MCGASILTSVLVATGLTWGLLPSAPARAMADPPRAPRDMNSAPGAPSAGTATTTRVYRYVLGVDSRRYALVRSRPYTTASVVMRYRAGARISGVWMTSSAGQRWLKLGPGRYVSSALLTTASKQYTVNGYMPRYRLCKIPARLNASDYGDHFTTASTTRYAACDAVKGLIWMDQAFYARFGKRLQVDLGYRTRYQQEWWFARDPIWWAKPGYSSHGLGLAVDFDQTMKRYNPYDYGEPYDRWLSAHSRRFGWDRPAHFDQGSQQTLPEFWHYEWVG